jgi:serine/threonine-protein phosphatase 2A regulatory subunit A
VELLSDSLLAPIKELAEDPQWRVRLAIMQYVPLVAKQLGVEFFDKKLGSLCIEWLEDPVFAIRSAATENLSKLAKLFGPRWTSTRIVPSILKLQDSKSYLLRVTLLKAISLLALDVDSDTKRGQLLPTVLALSSDRVANVRTLCVCAFLKQQQKQSSTTLYRYVSMQHLRFAVWVKVVLPVKSWLRKLCLALRK